MDNTPTQPTATPSSGNKYLLLAIILLILLPIGVAAAILMIREDNPSDNTDTDTQQDNSDSDTRPTDDELGTDTADSTEEGVKPDLGVTWSFNGTSWVSLSEQPSCPQPLTIVTPVTIVTPADLSKASNILYPGQTRGGDYKPHGGIRFDGESNDIAVKLPMDANLWRGSRYIESGEVQYLLDFIAPCGVMFRFDHLLTLSPELMEIIDTELPAAAVNDSRTTQFQTQKLFKAGDLVATQVGFSSPLNVSFDMGVYDLREQNPVSADSSWAAAHANEKETAFFGVCWLDLLVGTDKATAKALPGSGTEGKTSDYCD